MEVYPFLLSSQARALDSIPTLDHICLQTDGSRSAMKLEKETARVAQHRSDLIPSPKRSRGCRAVLAYGLLTAVAVSDRGHDYLIREAIRKITWGVGWRRGEILWGPPRSLVPVRHPSAAHARTKTRLQTMYMADRIYHDLQERFLLLLSWSLPAGQWRNSCFGRQLGCLEIWSVDQEDQQCLFK